MDSCLPEEDLTLKPDTRSSEGERKLVGENYNSFQTKYRKEKKLSN